jgi:uncharacterized protein YuzE
MYIFFDARLDIVVVREAGLQSTDIVDTQSAEGCLLEMDASGRVVGVTFSRASTGLNLRAIPMSFPLLETIQQLAGVLADTMEQAVARAA